MPLIRLTQINPPPVGDIPIGIDPTEVAMIRPLEGEPGTHICFKASSKLTNQCVREDVFTVGARVSGPQRTSEWICSS